MSVNLSVSCSTIWIINAPSGKKKKKTRHFGYILPNWKSDGTNEIQLKKQND